MPIPLLALAAAPAVAKGLLGAFQLTQHVNRVDTITPAEREQLAMARQSATSQLPGYARAQGRLAQIQNATVQSAALGAGSGSDFLAASAAAGAQRQQGETQLGQQYEQYRDRATQQLSNTLSAYSRHQQADTDRATQANAALKSGELNNLNNALTEGASVATYGALNGGAGSAAASNPFDASQVNKLLFSGPGNADAADAAGYRPGSNPYYRRSTNPYAGYLG